MGRTGYKVYFIADHLPVPFPQFNELQRKDLARQAGSHGPEIKYRHFSIFLSASRCFPYFTATNIDGSKFIRIKREDIFDSGRDEWSIDPRVTDYQWGQQLYDAKWSDFQRGHMTKREDPQWGDTHEDAREAAQDTFCFTNCVPQLGDLNQKDWGRLETYILSEESVKSGLRIALFTGPVLQDNDPLFVTEVQGNEVQLPTLFWKVVYYSPDGVTLNRVAFLMGQEKLLLERGIAVRRQIHLEEAPPYFLDFEDREIYQVSVSVIEALTGLTFTDANEPYTDKVPVRLRIKKVQVKAESLAPETMMHIDEATDYTIFDNIRLKVDTTQLAFAAGAEASPLSLNFLEANSARRGPKEQYTQEMKSKFGYFATWNPGLSIKLGTFGVLKGALFVRIGEIGQRGVQFGKTPPSLTPINFSYNSKGAVKITTKLAGSIKPAGSALGEADAGIIVEFSKENAVLFETQKANTSSIDDTVVLGEQILDLYRAGKWDKNWVVVTELISAEAATILISNSAGAKIELKANANLQMPQLNIADAAFSFGIASDQNMETRIVAQHGITPLFRLMGIKSSLFSGPEFNPLEVSSLDLLTPELAKSEPEQVQFDYISDEH